MGIILKFPERPLPLGAPSRLNTVTPTTFVNVEATSPVALFKHFLVMAEANELVDIFVSVRVQSGVVLQAQLEMACDEDPPSYPDDDELV
jgi:hypothetical protein